MEEDIVEISAGDECFREREGRGHRGYAWSLCRCGYLRARDDGSEKYGPVLLASTVEVLFLLFKKGGFRGVHCSVQMTFRYYIPAGVPFPVKNSNPNNC